MLHAGRLATLLIAICLPSSHPAAQPASAFLTLEGQATHRQRSPLPDDAVFHLTARDGRRTLAEQELPLGGRQVPIAFQLTVDRALIGPKTRIVLDGRITRGSRTLLEGHAAAQHEGTLIVLKPPQRLGK